jgi:hypothetical protein
LLVGVPGFDCGGSFAFVSDGAGVFGEVLGGHEVAGFGATGKHSFGGVAAVARRSRS